MGPGTKCHHGNIAHGTLPAPGRNATMVALCYRSGTLDRLATAVLAVALAGPFVPAIAQQTAFVDVTVVDVVAGRTLPHRTVLVTGGRIVRVSSVDSVPVDSTVRRIDGQGRFLVPGFADMHAHFARPEDFDLYLATGVTTVQLLNASADIRPWQDSIARGLRRGPTLHLCVGAISNIADTASARHTIADAQADGFSCLKLYDEITFEAYRFLTDEARRLGLRTVSHIPRNLTWEQALIARPTTIAHAEEFLYSPINNAAAVDSVVTGMRTGGISLIPTLTNFDLIGRQLIELPDLLRRPELAVYSPVHRRAWGPAYNRYTTRFAPERVSSFRRTLAFQRDLVRRLDSAGVLVVAGTDAYNDFVIPGYSLHDEMEQLVLSGLTPAAALRAATTNAAASLGKANDWGRVAEGAAADLVLLYGDPLRDITNTRLIAGVMSRGTWFTRAQTNGLLDSLRVRFAFEQRVIDTITRSGVPAGVALIDAERRRTGHMPLGVFALNELGWQYARMERTPKLRKAELTLTANARLFPRDPIATSSLAEFRAERRRDNARLPARTR